MPEHPETTYGDIEAVDAQPYPEVYANHTQLSMTLWDISMHFGTVMGLNMENNKLQVYRKVSVVLSPEQTKALHMALGGVIEKYERQFGKVRFPPSGEKMEMITHSQNLGTGEEISETIGLAE